jgi:Protein of unknown function DUF262
MGKKVQKKTEADEIEAVSRPRAASLSQQLQKERRTVDFDTFDIHTKQLTSMLKEGQIWAAPAYQRKFRWSPMQCSQLIESLLLGIPIPSLFMATNRDNTWEVVDGVQRLSTIAKFAGGKQLRKKLNLNGSLRLTGLTKLKAFENFRYEDLPASIRLHFDTRPMKVVTLSDKSDKKVRYDLFERLNTGGTALSSQEIRDCIYVGKFATRLDQLADYPNFRTVLKLTPLQQRNATGEECVLRFFAFKDKYLEFVHSVKDFLNEYMRSAEDSFNYEDKEAIFKRTFDELAAVFPNGLRRPGGKMTTPLNLFEGVAVGAALAIEKVGKIAGNNVEEWIASEALREFTTGATNNLSAVKGRIEFCRDRFLGIPNVPHVSATSN